MLGTIVRTTIQNQMDEQNELDFVMCFLMYSNLPDKSIHDYDYNSADNHKYKYFCWNKENVEKGI